MDIAEKDVLDSISLIKKSKKPGDESVFKHLSSLVLQILPWILSKKVLNY